MQDRSLYDQCITRGVLGSLLPVIYNNGNQIIQAPDVVVLRNEMIHETRVFYLDGRPHVSPRIRSYMGDSRARWEGDTLVVETTNMFDRNGIGGNGGGQPFSDALKITERFTRVDAETLMYRATVDDPRTSHAGPSRSNSRGGATRTTASTNTRATRATTRCTTSSAAPVPTNRQRGSSPAK